MTATFIKMKDSLWGNIWGQIFIRDNEFFSNPRFTRQI